MQQNGRDMSQMGTGWGVSSPLCKVHMNQYEGKKKRPVGTRQYCTSVCLLLPIPLCKLTKLHLLLQAILKLLLLNAPSAADVFATATSWLPTFVVCTMDKSNTCYYDIFFSSVSLSDGVLRAPSHVWMNFLFWILDIRMRFRVIRISIVQ